MKRRIVQFLIGLQRWLPVRPFRRHRLRPGPIGSMIRLLLLLITKTPIGLEFAMLILPVNGWPLLQVGKIAANVAPFGVVLGIDPLGGSNDRPKTGAGAGAGVAGINSTS